MQMILVLAALILQEPPKPLPTIDVSDPKDRASVRAVNDSLERLSEKVTACVTAGGKVESCRCSDPTDLASLRKGYDALIKEHPSWKDQLLSYQTVDKAGRNVSGTLVMQNLRRQLETLKCE
jgi:hypothetical protein